MIVHRTRASRGDLTLVEMRDARVAGGDVSIGSLLVLGLAAAGAFFLYKNYKVSKR